MNPSIRPEIHPCTPKQTFRVVLAIMLIVIGCGTLAQSTPVLPPPILPNPLPKDMSAGCVTTVKQFGSYLAEYNTQTANNKPIARARALVTLGVISYCVKRFEQGVFELTKAISLTANEDSLEGVIVWLDARRNLGYLYRDTNRPVLALEQFQLGLAKAKNQPTLKEQVALFHLTIGALYVTTGKCNEAKTSLNAARDIYKSLNLAQSVTATDDWLKQCP
jgi:tetratricopeptide (TPR) repeat protein